MASIPAQGAVLVNLDATQLPVGPLPTWSNTATLPGNFVSSDAGNPPVVARVGGVNGVALTGAAHYLGPVAPASVTDAGARTIEAWVFNPSGADFETIIAWGRRGGPDNTNNSFSHGVHPVWGSFGGWGAGDLDWQEQILFGQWNYVVYTYDGVTSSAYSNGALANSEDIALATFSVDTSNQPLPMRVGAANNADGTVFNGEPPSFTLAVVRVHDTALTAAEIQAKFDAEKASFGLLDSDSDGMPDYFENSYPFLNPNDATDATKDQDTDGLTNLEEFTAKTLPDNADTDGDGVNDGPELKRQVGGNAAPTNPLNADTDADGARDGIETGTGVFVGPNDLGSDPLVADTDGDTYSDGQEALAGSNPNDANSIPPPKPVVDLDATALALGPLAEWPNTGSIGGKFVSSGNPTITDQLAVKGVTLNGTTDFLTGPAVPAFLGGANSRTVEAWVFNPAAADEETIFSWGRRGGPDGSNCSFNHGLNGAFGAIGHWGSPDIGWNGVGPFTERWTYVVYTWDTTSLTTKVYADGQEANAETLPGPLNTWITSSTGGALPFRVGSQNEANGTATAGLRGSMTIARIRVHDRVLSAEDITEKYTEEAGEFGLIDFDGDGLPTGYERRYPGFLNPNDASDAPKDQDSDGLTNLEEYQNNTAPDVADTDRDTVLDGAEVKRNPPTHPLRPDTDQDGLTDAAETVTDPVSVDSDGDGYPDGQEVAHGSNPTLATSVPDLTVPVAIVDLNAASLPEGPLGSWPDSGKLGWPFSGDVPATVTQVSGVKGVTFEGSQYYTGPAAPVFIGGSSARSVDAWLFNPVADTEESVISWGRRGGPDGSNAAYIHGTNPTFGAIGHWGTYDVGWDGHVVAGVWTHVAYVYDAASTTAIVYSDGQLANTVVLPGATEIFNTDTADRPLPIRVGIQNIAGGGVGGQFASLSLGRVRVYDIALTADTVAQIYANEKSAYTPVNIVLEIPVYDAANDRITLNWNATSGTTYSVDGANDLSQSWQSVANGLTTGTYTINNASSKLSQLYRVRTE